jgi:hypothetical protein
MRSGLSGSCVKIYCGLAILLTAFLFSAPLHAAQVVLRDSTMLASFSSRTGALTRVEYKTTHWHIQRHSAFVGTFRMLVPIKGRRDNWILGSMQHGARVRKINANTIKIQWKHLISQHAGTLPITFTATVTLKGGALKFAAQVKNNSSLTIETVDYPCLDNLRPPTAGTNMSMRSAWYGNLGGTEIYPNFGNGEGYWGVNYPTKMMANSSSSLWSVIQCSDNQGLYLQINDPKISYLVEYTFVVKPGEASWESSHIPHNWKVAGMPMHMEMRATHFIYAAAHSTVNLAPVVMQGYRGDWHAGANIYKKWLKTWFVPPHIPHWARTVNSWQQFQVNSPVDSLNMSYKNLVKIGRDCAKYGVKAIQLTGWQKGGQDRGNPSLSIDPELGTWQDLHRAITKIQAMGVKCIMFIKPQFADMSTKWYKTQLYKYDADDPFGVPYTTGGFGYFTPPELAGISHRPWAVMDTCDPAYRAIAVKEFDKVLALGAAGVLQDQVCDPGAMYSFTPHHGHPIPGYLSHGQMLMGEAFNKAAFKVDPHFLFAGEGPEDWLLQYYPLMYIRVGPGSVPVTRYIFPHEPIMIAVTGFNDRETINQALLDRYIISYEPYYFKGRLEDYPLTMAYGEKVDALRRRYKAYLWNADFRDNLGASVKANGWQSYSVFQRKDGKRAVVVMNREYHKAIVAHVSLPHPGKLVVVTPEDPNPKSTNGTVRIPANSAAVILEQ